MVEWWFINEFLMTVSHQYLTNVLTDSYPPSRPNHASYRKLYFTEFVQNSLGFTMGIILFDLQPHGGCLRPKTPLRGQKRHERVDLLKKYSMKVSQQPQKPLRGSNQI